MDQVIGSQISRRRRTLDLTAQQVSDLLGIPIADYEDIEAGRCQATPAILYHLARRFHVTLGYFHDPDEPVGPN
ncbi:MAG: helix-turn-helix domain-containing protein [Asticcacaulis sp.]|uniref:helix-turn-helix domain-containing protein n=1 Tax=Asticcacaulis sp. TaxID=1872648 RepID=UPI003F7BCB36